MSSSEIIFISNGLSCDQHQVTDPSKGSISYTDGQMKVDKKSGDFIALNLWLWSSKKSE